VASAPSTPELSPLAREPAQPATLVPALTIIPRSTWTKASVRANHDPMGTIRRITVHHTGEHLTDTGLDEGEILRRLERYHVESRGWAAIGYHLLVGRDGRVWEGRPLRCQGAHVTDHNPGNLGITVLGDFMTRRPASAQLAGLRHALDQLCSRYALPRQALLTHRDLRTTACPGDFLFAWVRGYRAG
jgi:N-acetylmuramoyl-L-alanine amidase